MRKPLQLSIFLLSFFQCYLTFGQFDIISVISEPVVCHGEYTGSITIEISGGTPPYAYALYKGGAVVGYIDESYETIQVFAGLNAGVYFIGIIDAEDNSYSRDVTVTQPTPLEVDISPDPVQVCPGTGRQLYGNPSGGNGDYAHNWTGGGAIYLNSTDIEDPVFLSPDIGTFDLTYTVIDHKGCQAEESIAVEVFDAMSAGLVTTGVSCYNGADGSIEVTGATGGSGSYRYRLDEGAWQSSTVFGSLSAGEYQVWMSDANYPDECITYLGMVEIDQPEVLDAAISHSPVTCFDGSDGTITISDPSGGSGSYQYRISGTDWQPSGLFENLAAGDYAIEIRDANSTGCVIELDDSYTVTQPEILDAMVSHTDASCFGGSGGTITISDPSGGSGSYQYRISGEVWQATGFFDNLAAGDYVVEIRDANSTGCVIELDNSYIVTQPDILDAAVSHTDASCFDGSDGTITISDPSGGSGGYQYRISGTDWQSSGLFVDLSAGNYVVEMRDATGCTVELEGSYTVSQPEILNAVITAENVTCHGLADGSVTISGATGGSGTYEYRIGGGIWYEDGSFTGLAAGSYPIEIRDMANTDCFIVLDGSYAISEPAPLGGTYSSADVTGCHGDATGWIEIFPEGSWAAVTDNYEYSIDGGSSWPASALFDNLTAGSYNLQVRDGDNPSCIFIIEENLVLDQPDPITAELEYVNVDCNGGNNGEIRFVNVLGGSGIYQFSITGFATTGQTSPVFPNLPAGTYDARVRNNSGPACPTIINSSLVITQPDILNATVEKTDVSGCHGNSNGQINITSPSGGSDSYLFSIDGGGSWQTGALFENLAAGIYQVWIKDEPAADCSRFIEDIEILQPGELQGELSVTDVSCFAGSDGSIEITDASGGSGNYEFSADGSLWHSGPVLTGFAAGSYTIFMRDADFPACQADPGTADINQPDAVILSIEQVTGNDCHGGSGGSIAALASGGTAGYVYSLYDGGGLVSQLEPVNPSPALFSNLSAGTYTVTATDSRGCDPATETGIIITQPDEVEIISVVLQHVECHGAETGEITVTAGGGTGGLRYSVDGIQFFDNGGNFTGLPAGIYDVAVTDENDCTVSHGQVEIMQSALLAAEVTVTDVSCFGLDDGVITISDATGGTAGNFQYSVNGADWFDSPLFEDLSAGTYNVWMRDADVPGCFVELAGSPVDISRPDPLGMVLDIVNVDCHGNASGSITVTASGGNGDYRYRLNAGDWQDDPHFGGLTAGSYIAGVTDARGCMVDQEVLLTGPDELIFHNIASNDETCFGADDGDIEIFVQGGTPPYRYSTDGGTSFQAESYFDELAPGFYPVAAEDASGCIIHFPEAIRIEPATEITLDIVISHVTCNGHPDGSISVQAFGGAGGFQYSLDGEVWQAGGLFGSLPAGDYIVHARDINQCIVSESITISQPDELVVSANVLNVACHGSPDDPAIEAMAEGGTYPYTITLLQGGAEIESFAGVAEGVWVVFGSLSEGITNYEVVVDDAAACLRVSSGMLETVIPDELSIISISTADITCYGENTGLIRIEVTGGTAPYHYSLFDNENVLIDEMVTNEPADFGQLPAGIYRASIIDSNNCGPVQENDIEILQADELVVDNIDHEQISCYGSSDGSIELTASGGTGDIVYSINGGIDFHAGNSFPGLDGGSYEIMVRDDAACISTAGIIELVEPEELQFAHVQVENIIIGSQNNSGSIEILMEGGRDPYIYSIDNGETVHDNGLFENLEEGVYLILVADQNGCTADTSVVIERVTNIIVSVERDSPSCFGYDDGTIIISAGPGYGSYEYSIDGGSTFYTSPIFTELTSGEYNIVVRDTDTGYPWQGSVVLSDPDPLEASAAVQPASCNRNSADGSVELTVSGGTGSYSYLWSTGTVEKDLHDLEAGEYDVLINDDHYCELLLPVTVGYENSITVTLTEDSLICPGESITLEAMVEQTGSSVIYSWGSTAGTDPPPVASPVVSPVTSTGYTVRVADENNCYDEAQVHVGLHDLQGIFIGNDTVVMQGSTIELSANGGEFVSYSWVPPTGLSEWDQRSTTALITNDRQYVVYATTEEGCQESASIFIAVIKPVHPVSGFSPNGDGINDMFDIENAASYPDITVEIFNRSGQRVFYSRGYSDNQRWNGTYNGRELPVGTYYFIITLNDGHGTRPLTGPVTIIR